MRLHFRCGCQTESNLIEPAVLPNTFLSIRGVGKEVDHCKRRDTECRKLDFVAVGLKPAVRCPETHQRSAGQFQTTHLSDFRAEQTE